MEKERILIATDRVTLKSVLTEIFKPESGTEIVPDFKEDKLTKFQAATLAGISIPTLNNLIKAGKFKEHSMGRKKYLLKSEMLTVLRNSNI
jgi:hypothetical protein